ncbi:hypothetical protein IFM89_001722 [Coptis chinensis]|uniref:Ribosomal protein eL8/eL30/eS12/Gadd45 domain-containing protein n=1 Tax=Coptis chinensis TaxID=261450 RepID=A0A835HHG8_9MAGN|nr:hypothetical protein IFM89_001722 [Coptis chinensis]
MARSKKNKSKASSSQQQEGKHSNCFEGERLLWSSKVSSEVREIESAKISRGGLPEKVWIKPGNFSMQQQFAIGVNDVTRVLERMSPSSLPGKATKDSSLECGGGNDSAVQLQAVLLASDCNPRVLTKHIPSLASSRGVPLIIVKDKKGGSLRLGELVKLKTAIAIGVKAKGNGINKLVEEVLESIETVSDTTMTEVG